MKKIVTRTCMGCNQKKDKDDLLRIVKNKENIISVDETGKKAGRGAYICKDEECLKKLIKNRRLEKAFKMKIKEDVFENIKEVIVTDK